MVFFNKKHKYAKRLKEHVDGWEKLGVNIVKYEVEVKTPVNKIPEFLEADLSGLQIGDSIHISSIKLDPDVSTIIKDRDFTIATIAPPTVMAVEETKEEEETVDEEGAEKTEESKDSPDQPEEEKEKNQEKNNEDDKK